MRRTIGLTDPSGGSRKKSLVPLVAWPLIIWEATTAKRNYYRTKYLKIWEPGQDLGAVPPGPKNRHCRSAGPLTLTTLTLVHSSFSPKSHITR